MSRKILVKFNTLNSGLRSNEYCWQEVESNYMGDTIKRHTRLDILDVDKTHKTVLMTYLLGDQLIKLNEKEFNDKKFFRHVFKPKTKSKSKKKKTI